METMSVEQFNREFRGGGEHRPQRSHGGRNDDGRGMNKAEQRMAMELEILLRSGELKLWLYASVKVRLADRTWYTPDFFIVWADGRIEFREIKGHWEDDARVKFKVARELHPWAAFTAWRLTKGEWQVV